MRGIGLALGLVISATVAWAQEFALTAPDKVGIRGAFEVTWTGPSDERGIIEIRPAEGTGRRVGYAYTLKNPQPLEAPEAPGAYTVVLVFGGEDRASLALDVHQVSATLSAPRSADAGAELVVSWKGPDNRSDHITFAQRDGAPLRGTSYAYTGNSRDGTVTLIAPPEAAAYDIVYVTGETVLARHPITVGSVAATLTAPGRVAAGASVEVGFDGPDNPGDRVTWAARDGDPISPASYAYTGNADQNTVTLRAFEAPGAYDIVYVAASGIIGRIPVEITDVTIALDAPDEVEALSRFAVSWAGDGNQGDRILVVEPDADDSRHYRHVDPRDGILDFTAPDSPGEYELAYVTRGGRELARRPLTVTPAPVPPGMVEVPLVPGGGFGPDDAVEVILDASGSMLQQQDGTRRIDIAKHTLRSLLTDTIPEGTGFALRVFGNREADACRTDLEIPLAPLDSASAALTVDRIEAINLARTPIAHALRLSAEDLAGVSGERMLILVTDGEETCGGDPGRTIAELRSAGLDLRVNIVGYAIDDDALRRSFEAWAAAGGGRYLDAGSAGELSEALKKSTAAPFAVTDSSDALVLRGVTGDPPAPLPAGRYTITIGETARDLVVEPGETVRVTP